MNNVVLIGRLTRDPELRYIPNSGKAVATFSLAVDKQLSKDKKQELEGKNQPTADFIRVVVWGKMGENCANYLAKGRLTGVQGRIQTGSYIATDGIKKYTTEVIASNVEFLEWGDKGGKSNQDSQESRQDNSGLVDFPDMDGFHPTDYDDIPF